MNLHTSTGHAARLGVGGCTIVLALTWPSSSLAADEVPRHRVELTADRSLRGGSNPFDFSAILTNWVPVSTLDPTAPRALVVRIRRLPDGGKSVDTTITDEAGAAAHTEHHDYPPTEDGVLDMPVSGTPAMRSEQGASIPANMLPECARSVHAREPAPVATGTSVSQGEAPITGSTTSTSTRAVRRDECGNSTALRAPAPKKPSGPLHA